MQAVVFIIICALFLSFYGYRYWTWIKYLMWKFRVLPHYEQALRQKRGVCRKCGYDMRASPLRCPECGTMARSSG